MMEFRSPETLNRQLSEDLSGNQGKAAPELQSLIHPGDQKEFFNAATKSAESSTSLRGLPAVDLRQLSNGLAAPAGESLVKVLPPATMRMENSALDALKQDIEDELKAVPEISSTLAQRIFGNAAANQPGDAYFAAASKEIAAKHEMLQAFAVVDVTARGPASLIESSTAPGVTPALDEVALRDLQIKPILENALKGINMQDKIPIKLALGKEEISANLGISLMREEVPRGAFSKLSSVIARIGRSALRAAL